MDNIIKLRYVLPVIDIKTLHSLEGDRAAPSFLACKDRNDAEPGRRLSVFPIKQGRSEIIQCVA